MYEHKITWIIITILTNSRREVICIQMLKLTNTMHDLSLTVSLGIDTSILRPCAKGNNGKDVLELMDISEETFCQNDPQLIDLSDDECMELPNIGLPRNKIEVIDICDDEGESHKKKKKKKMEIICLSEDEDSNEYSPINVTDKRLLYRRSNSKGRKMSKIERDLCSSRVSSRLKQAGATFPKDDFDTSSCSGNSDVEEIEPIICIKCPQSLENELTYTEFDAAKLGNVQYLKEWLKNGNSVNARDWAGMTLLHIACFYGHTALLELLLDHPKVHLNIADYTDCTPLVLANNMGHWNLGKMLTDHKGKCQVSAQTIDKLLYSEDKCNWEIIMNILNISLDIHTSILNNVLIVGSHQQQWNIVHKVLQCNVKFSDLALEKVLDCAKMNGKFDLLEDISMKHSHIISDKILIQATIHQQWKFMLILLKSKSEFRKETLELVFCEAFKILDTDIMQYYFTEKYSDELLDFETLKIVFGRIMGSKSELSQNTASLLDVKVKNSIYPFKMNTNNCSLGSIWSHNLDGNVQVPEICKNSVSGYCKKERNICPCLHATENFHWQISFTGIYWINLTKQQSQCIEEAFCNPYIDNCYPFSNSQLSTISMQEKGIMSLLGKGNWVVDFKYNIITDYMTQSDTNFINYLKHVFIRRLAVKDSVANQFQWYFNEHNDLWLKYGNKSTMGETANITSDGIEQKYLNSIDSSSIQFVTKTESYTLYFNKMEQVNTKTGMIRLVKRRPKKHLILSLCYHNEIIKPNDSNLLFKVDNPAGDYKDIYEKLKNQIDSDIFLRSHIESVEKVNNIFLQRAFKLRLEMMETQYVDSCNICIKKVLHGTKKEFVEKIVQENFDWRLHGKSNGKVFGQGAYFTPDPKLALSYAKPDGDGKRYIIISSIIVGFMTIGNKNMEKPIDHVTNLPYDTSVNNLINPSIYVKYNKQEYCPEYVVTIKINS